MTQVRMSLRSGAIVLAALGLAAPALAQDWTGNGRLEGKVLDPDGKPVAEVVVKLANPERGGGPTVKTNKKGQWAYLGLAAGNWNIDFDDAGAIGKRYRRQDEIGTPFCITVDFDTLDDHAVTVRERDSMAQERIPLEKVEGWLAQHLVGC